MKSTFSAVRIVDEEEDQVKFPPEIEALLNSLEV